MTKAEYKKQLEKAIQARECGEDLIVVKFQFKWSKTLYKLYGNYQPDYYKILWRLFKQNTDDLTHTLKYYPNPDARIDVPFTILYTISQFEQDLFYN